MSLGNQTKSSGVVAAPYLLGSLTIAPKYKTSYKAYLFNICDYLEY